MAQKPIELILLKDVLSQMELPVTMVDARGNVVFVNEQAERLLGMRLDDLGEVPLALMAERQAPMDESGRPLPFEELPIRVALRDRRPKQAQLVLHDVAGRPHHITTTAVPLDGQGGALLGAMAIFWETDGT